MPAIYTAVNELRAAGVDVLSPSDPRVVDYLGEFLFVASDKLRSVKLVQDRHFEAIRRSDFLWVVCPDGYTGPSTSAEIGAAHMSGTIVFAEQLPLDATLQHYVRKVPSIRAVVDVLQASQKRPPSPIHLLLDPDQAIETSHVALDQMRSLLSGDRSNDVLEREVADARAIIRTSLGFKHSDA
jgi:hypothetical protein